MVMPWSGGRYICYRRINADLAVTDCTSCRNMQSISRYLLISHVTFWSFREWVSQLNGFFPAANKHYQILTPLWPRSQRQRPLLLRSCWRMVLARDWIILTMFTLYNTVWLIWLIMSTNCIQYAMNTLPIHTIAGLLNTIQLQYITTKIILGVFRVGISAAIQSPFCDGSQILNLGVRNVRKSKCLPRRFAGWIMIHATTQSLLLYPSHYQYWVSA